MSDVLTELEATGAVIEARGEHLHVEAPRGVLTAEHRRRLAEQKPVLLVLLTAVEGTGWTARDLWEALAPEDRADVQAGDVEANTLRAFMRAVDDRLARESGHLPASYTEVAFCERCGPIWLWINATVHGFPWCANRRQGRPIPRP